MRALALAAVTAMGMVGTAADAAVYTLSYRDAGQAIARDWITFDYDGSDFYPRMGMGQEPELPLIDARFASDNPGWNWYELDVSFYSSAGQVFVSILSVWDDGAGYESLRFSGMGQMLDGASWDGAALHICDGYRVCGERLGTWTVSAGHYSPTPVPLPAAGLALPAAIGALALLRRRVR